MENFILANTCTFYKKIRHIFVFGSFSFVWPLKALKFIFNFYLHFNCLAPLCNTRKLPRAWRKNRWNRRHKTPHFQMCSLRMQIEEETVMQVCFFRLWFCYYYEHGLIICLMLPSVFDTKTGSVEPSRLQTSVSPADLHGMWYPTVRRTLVCLSKLYRCIDVRLQCLKETNLKCCKMSTVYF